MTDLPQYNDDTIFDRLVDGELPPAERQQLLASLDRSDDGWRRCALAFLEAQTWGNEFKHLLAEPTSEPVTPVSSLAANRSAISAGKWFAIAASLLLAFSLGWLVKSPASNSQQRPDLAAIEQRVDEPQPDEVPGLASDDAVTLLVRDTSGQDRRLQVPLMEVGDFNEQFGSALPANLRDSFRNRGIDVQRRRRFAPMFFEQNEQLVPMVVPVDDTYIVPVSQPIY